MTPAGAESTAAFTERIFSALAQIDGEVPLIVGHSGVFRVLCPTPSTSCKTEAPVTNALPLRFTLLAEGWKLEALS